MKTPLAYLRQSIRTIADYPKPGIQFRDITTLLRDRRAFEITIEALVEPWRDQKIDKVAGIEARGFILGGAVAPGCKCGFIPIRKRGKLPHETVRVAYSLEYGVDEMEMHKDAIERRRTRAVARRSDRHRRHRHGRRPAAAARPAPTLSGLSPSSSICPRWAARRVCGPPASPYRRCSRSDGARRRAPSCSSPARGTAPGAGQRLTPHAGSRAGHRVLTP